MDFSKECPELLTLASLREAPKKGMVKKSRKPGQQMQPTVRPSVNSMNMKDRIEKGRGFEGDLQMQGSTSSSSIDMPN